MSASLSAAVDVLLMVIISIITLGLTFLFAEDWGDVIVYVGVALVLGPIILVGLTLFAPLVFFYFAS